MGLTGTVRKSVLKEVSQWGEKNVIFFSRRPNVNVRLRRVIDVKHSAVRLSVKSVTALPPLRWLLLADHHPWPLLGDLLISGLLRSQRCLIKILEIPPHLQKEERAQRFLQGSSNSKSSAKPSSCNLFCGLIPRDKPHKVTTWVHLHRVLPQLFYWHN